MLFRSTGYTATGFWAGLTLGRITLPALNQFVGEKRIIFVYIGIAVCMELIYWFVPHLIVDAVAQSFVGLLLGPFYPNAISVVSKILPRSLHTSAIGFMSGIGASGAALFPFIVGALSQKWSTIVLPGTVIVLLAGQALLWAFVPTVKRRGD